MSKDTIFTDEELSYFFQSSKVTKDLKKTNKDRARADLQADILKTLFDKLKYQTDVQREYDLFIKIRDNFS